MILTDFHSKISMYDTSVIAFFNNGCLEAVTITNQSRCRVDFNSVENAMLGLVTSKRNMKQ